MRLYWFVAFALAWAITLPTALAQLGFTGSSIVPWQAGVLIGLAPAIAAIVAAAREGNAKSFMRGLARGRAPLLVYAAAFLLPLAGLALAVAAGRLRGEPIPVAADAGLVSFALLWLVLAFGEEIGWRGFALPQLAEKHGFWIGSLILGLIWCIWHYPRLLGSPYVSGLADAAPLIAAFSVQIVIANFILCWLYYRANRSVVVPTIFHTVMNVVATAYYMAATDWTITAFFGLVVLGIAIWDRTFLASLRDRPRTAAGSA